MAIKIKNRDKGPEEPLEEGEGTGLPPQGTTGGLDNFERTAFLATNWVEENRKLIATVAILLVLAVIAGVLGLQYVRGQQVEASDRLSQALAAYDIPVEGSPELEAIRQQEEIPDPPKIFATEQERWEAIFGGAEHTLADFDRGPIAASARMTKAAAALNLERFDQAEALYREVLADSETHADLRPFAQMGLANSLAAQGNIDGAREAWQQFAQIKPERASYADFELARLLERSGERAEARQHYEQFLEKHPDSEFRSEVERRLALL